MPSDTNGPCGESMLAARLWLERNRSASPTHSIIRLAIRSVTGPVHSANADAVLKQCLERLGEDKWVRFCRWFLITESSVGAAKVLFDRGECRLSVLGNVAMAAMHDGG